MRITNTGLLYRNPSQATPGYLLICPCVGDKAILLDPNFEVVHEWQTSGGITNWSYLLPNGNLFANERCENRKGVALTVSGRLREYTANGTLVWSHEDPYQHHDARRLANGVVYAAFTELSTADKALIQGGIPGSETPGGPFGEVIREVNNVGDVVWEFHFKELGFTTYPLHRNANRWSYGHTNTVCPVGDGTYLISSKNMNLLFIVDPSTNSILWEYQNDELGGQHDAQVLNDGNILVVWEIERDSKEIVWRYSACDDMTSFFSPHMGGAQRLPSGNTLICEGNKGCLFEVTSNGDIVSEYVSPHFVNSEMFGFLEKTERFSIELTQHVVLPTSLDA